MNPEEKTILDSETKFSNRNHISTTTENLQPGTCNLEPGSKWFAIYTKPRAGKQVFHRLPEQGHETYLPLVKTLRQWSDRKKLVEVPLIPSYIFVKIRTKNKVEVQINDLNLNLLIKIQKAFLRKLG